MSARCWEQPPRNCRKSSIFLQGFVTDHLPPPSPPSLYVCAGNSTLSVSINSTRAFPRLFLPSPTPSGRSADENHLAGFGRSDKKIGEERERELPCLQPVINLTSTPAAIVSSFLRFAGRGLASIDHHPGSFFFFYDRVQPPDKKPDVKSSHGVSIHLFARALTSLPGNTDLLALFFLPPPH